MRPQIHPEHHQAHDELTVGEGANVNVNKFHFSDRALSIIALVFSSLAVVLASLAVGFSVTGWYMATRSVSQSEATRQQVMQHDALIEAQKGANPPRRP